MEINSRYRADINRSSSSIWESDMNGHASGDLPANCYYNDPLPSITADVSRYYVVFVSKYSVARVYLRRL